VKDLNFAERCLEVFPRELPRSPFLGETSRPRDKGWEILLTFVPIEWPAFAISHSNQIGGEIHWVSHIWLRYYLPAYMILSLKEICKPEYKKWHSELEVSEVDIYAVIFKALLNGDISETNLEFWNNFTNSQSLLIAQWLSQISKKTFEFEYFNQTKLEELTSLFVAV